MSKITTHTEKAALHKSCYRQGACIASQCMAWSWIQAGRFTCNTGLLLPRYAESAFEGYLGNDDPEMPDLDAANFYQPIGDGWQFNTFEAGDDGWEAHWERDTDPERQGYCAALQHPLAVVGKLEEIITTIYEASNGGNGK
jgi:hypothetical protein